MLDLFGNVLTAIVGGGATGLLGSVISTFSSYMTAKENNRHKEAMADHDRKLAELEANRTMTIARTEADAAITVADAELQAASYKHDAATYSGEAVKGLRGWFGQVARFWLAMVDVARGFIRPAATIYFIGLTSYLTIVAVNLLGSMGENELQAMAVALVPQVFVVILYITTTIIFWWFGVRPTRPSAGT